METPSTPINNRSIKSIIRKTETSDNSKTIKSVHYDSNTAIDSESKKYPPTPYVKSYQMDS